MLGQIVECRLTVPDDKNNVQVISLTSEDVQTLVQQSTTLRVKVTRRSLNTLSQPVSIVVTGAFNFNAVEVSDDTSQDEGEGEKTEAPINPDEPDDDPTQTPSGKDDGGFSISPGLIYTILSIVMYVFGD